MERCSNCGAELSAGTKFCPSCGVQVGAVAAQVETFEPSGGFSGDGQSVVTPTPTPMPTTVPVGAEQAFRKKIENHLIKSIIATLCCCAPIGLVSVIYAARVDALLQYDNYAAMEASKKAGLWSTLAIGIGLVVNTLVTILMTVYRFNEGYGL